MLMQLSRRADFRKLLVVNQAIRVVLIEDQRRTREGLVSLINGSPGMLTAGHYGSAEEALLRIAADRPDVVLSDLGLPGMSGIELVRKIHEMLPQVPILVLTIHGEDRNVFNALCAGACGYLLKDIEPPRLVESIRQLHAGGAPMSPEVARRVVLMFQKLVPPQAGQPRLSERELEVLQLLADGSSYKACAHRLCISIDTVRFHVRNIYGQLHVHSKSEAVLKALKSGWVH
jgi:DNA-binding NarL/FixJ family response regulator